MQEAVRETLLEMLIQRGYTDISHNDEGDIICKKEKGAITVFFNSTPKVNNDRIQEYISKMRPTGVKHAIVIFIDSVTPAAQKVVDEMQDLRIELFCSKSLRFNITKHRLVPRHTLLTKVEMKIFKEEFGIKIPILLYNDPIARFYDFQRGDIVKVERLNGFICYRIVK